VGITGEEILPMNPPGCRGAKSMRLLACHHRTTTPAHDSDEVGNLVAHMSLLLPEAKEQKRRVWRSVFMTLLGTHTRCQ